MEVFKLPIFWVVFETQVPYPRVSFHIDKINNLFLQRNNSFKKKIEIIYTYIFQFFTIVL